LSSGTGGRRRLSGICDGRGTLRDLFDLSDLSDLSDLCGEFSSCFTWTLRSAGVLDLDLLDLDFLDRLRFGENERLSSRNRFFSGSGVGVRRLLRDLERGGVLERSLAFSFFD
jgi:hypothetical protein